MYKLLIASFTAVGFTLALPYLATAQDIYIDANAGSDSNSCISENAPCASFAGVESVVQPGDDMYVTGAFPGGLFLNNSFRGTSDKELIIQQWDGQSAPTMNITSEELSGLSIGGDNVIVSDFIFVVEGFATSFNTSGDNVTLQNSTISGTGLIPISIAGGTGNRIIGNTIEAGLTGISISGTNHTISRNRIYCATGEGCNIGVSLTSADSFLVSNNVIMNFVTGVTESVNPIAITLDESSTNNVIAHNTTFNNKNAVSTSGADNTTLRNNIFTTNDDQYIYAYLSSSDFLEQTNADYNDYYLKGSGGAIANVDAETTFITTLSDWRTATGFDLNTIATDPLFTDTSGSEPDLSLTENSPAIDAGVDFPGVVDDFNGNVRPVGDAPDMGAFEYGSDSDSAEVNPPTDIVVNNIKTRKATVQWAAPAGLVSYYELTYATNKTFTKNVKVISNLTDISHQLTKLKSNQKYQAKMRTAYVSGENTVYSDYSDRFTFLTKAAPPKKVFAPVAGSTFMAQADGSFLVTLKVRLQNKKKHSRKKLKAIVNLVSGGKKLKFQKFGKAGLKKSQSFKVKGKKNIQSKQFVIPAQYAEKKMNWKVRLQRVKTNKSKFKASKKFIPAQL